MGGSEHDGGSVRAHMQAPPGSRVTQALPYDWGFLAREDPRKALKRASRGS